MPAQSSLTKKTRDDPIYAVFVRGKWSVVGAQSYEGEPLHPYVAGRAVLDKNGRVLNAQLGGYLPPRPAFGPFNDE
jgi:hypothetical protein